QRVLLVGKTTSLRGTFRKMLTDAPDFVTMKENRFIVFSGKDKNLPEDKALVWLDWRTGRSAYAVIHHFRPEDPAKYSKEPLLYIGTTTLNKEGDLPPTLKFALKNWVLIENVVPSAITYNGAPASASLVF